MSQVNRKTYLIDIYHLLEARFSVEELKTLCFKLKAIRYEDLPGAGRKDKIRELVELFDRLGRMDELETAVRQARPRIKFPSKPLDPLPRTASRRLDGMPTNPNILLSSPVAAQSQPKRNLTPITIILALLGIGLLTKRWT
ncbi:MAG: hypothetical protein AAF614_37170 [Chloroflexota bacterium]